MADEISFYQVSYDGEMLAHVSTVGDQATMTFYVEPPDRMMFHPDALVSMDPALGKLDNNGTLVLTATNGVATYKHTDAQDGCLVFERVSWQRRHPECGQLARRSTPEDAGVEEDDVLFPWCCDPCNALFDLPELS